MFPDVLERKVTWHFEQGDHVRFSEFLFLVLRFLSSEASIDLFFVAWLNGRFQPS